jgi:hypothetical protein
MSMVNTDHVSPVAVLVGRAGLAMELLAGRPPAVAVLERVVQ